MMSINMEEKHISSIIQTQQQLKKILINYMQKIADSTDNINLDYADDILKFLENLKISLNYCNQNIALLKNISKIDNPEQTSKNLETIFKSTIYIEDFLNSVISFSELKFFNNSHEIEKATISNVQVEIKPTEIEKPQIANEINSTVTAPTDCKAEFKENTLIISETKGKVILPYNISELEEILKSNSDKYSSIEEIIEKDYTLSFDLFKNLSIARFREAFKLVRTIEKKSIKAAFDLGMELLFNYNLHPAIIAACKNLDELDIYLDYLENNETDKFDCFKIVFEIAPVISKKGRH